MFVGVVAVVVVAVVVAAGGVAHSRITFSHCPFPIFEIRVDLLNFHQNPPTRKYTMFSYGKWNAFQSGICEIAKVSPPTNILHFSAKVRKCYASKRYF